MKKISVIFMTIALAFVFSNSALGNDYILYAKGDHLSIRPSKAVITMRGTEVTETDIRHMFGRALHKKGGRSTYVFKGYYDDFEFTIDGWPVEHNLDKDPITGSFTKMYPCYYASRFPVSVFIRYSQENDKTVVGFALE